MAVPLQLRGLGQPGVLDAVHWASRDTLRFRVTFGTGTPEDVRAEPVAGADRVTTVRAAFGGLIVEGETDVPGHVTLALRAGPLACATQPAEPGLLAGRDVAVLFAADAPAEAVAAWLAYHARHHGLGGAVIVGPARLADALGPTSLALVLLVPSHPLGQPGQPAASDLGHAPGAPGRPPPGPPDPWRAPLGAPLVVEAIRRRFLVEATGVLAADVSDYVLPGDRTVFDAARDAPPGVRLAGRLAYPWRVRAGLAAAIGDHVCTAFDRDDRLSGWCVVPARLPPRALLGPGRVLGAQLGTPVPFVRAMALRHPGHPVAALVPKASLVADPGLVALAGRLGAKPVLPPARRVAAPASERTVIVTTMKNEGPFILEWLAWHRAIGVDDVLVYTNDCTDGTDAILDVLASRGLVTHRANPFRGTGLKPQHAALRAAETEAVVRGAGWIVAMDVDEFITVHTGAGRLADLHAAVPDATMVALTWRLFGSADVHAYADRFVTEQFTRCAPEATRKPHQAWGIKTLFRNDGSFAKLGVHRPKGLAPERAGAVAWVNGSGAPMPQEMLRTGWRSTAATVGYGLVSLNHYAVRSAESFLVKRDRGRVNHVDRDQGLAYWFRMNLNAAEDARMAARRPMLDEAHAALIADPAIAAAHAACVAAHRARIAELRAEAAPAAFYAEITAPRMERLCRMQHHFGGAVFLAGPGAIPSGVGLDPVPEDWFFTLDARP